MTEDDDRKGLRHFDLAMAGIVGVVLSPFVSWWAFVQQLAGPWKRRLFGLAVVDTLVVVCALVILKAPPLGATGTARIGVELNPEESSAGVEVVGVTPGSPAERSGLHVGDKIEALDGSPVSTNDRFRKDVGDGAPGAVRRLRVQRADAELDVTVVPVVGLKSAQGPPKPLFTRTPRTPAFHGAGGYVAMLVVLVVVGVVARRRQVGLRPLRNVIGTMASAWAVATAVGFVFQKTIGPSLGAVLVGMLASGVTMVILAVFSVRQLRRELPTEGPPPEAADRLRTLPAFARGLLYAFAGAMRAAILIAALSPVLRLPNHSPADVFGVTPSWGPVGIGLFVVAGAILAPIAEECVFRGVLLMWLTRWMTSDVAIVVSALAFGVGHLFYGASVLVPLVYGLVLGWMRLRTGRLRAGIALHMCLNATATALLLLKG